MNSTHKASWSTVLETFTARATVTCKARNYSTPGVLLVLFVAAVSGAIGCKQDDAGINRETQATATASSATAASGGTRGATSTKRGTSLPTAKPGSAGSTAASSAPPGPNAPNGDASAAAGAATAKASGTKLSEGPAASPKGKKKKRRKRRQRIKLLSAGKEPRRKLRLKVKEGHREKMRMVTKVAMKMSVSGKQLPGGSLPEMIMGMALKVTEVQKDGDIRYEFKLTEADVRAAPNVPPKALQALRQAIGQFIGINGYSLVTNRGVQKKSKLNLPPKIDAQSKQLLQGLEQGMQRVLTPLPRQAVGLGARWQQRNRVLQSGIRMIQVSTYELVEMTGDTIKCKVDVTQKAGKQKVASPLGVTVNLHKLSSLGSGKSTLRLIQLSPLHSVMAVSTDVMMGLPQKKQMSMTTDLTVIISSTK